MLYTLKVGLKVTIQHEAKCCISLSTTPLMLDYVHGTPSHAATLTYSYPVGVSEKQSTVSAWLWSLQNVYT